MLKDAENVAELSHNSNIVQPQDLKYELDGLSGSGIECSEILAVKDDDKSAFDPEQIIAE